MPEPRADMFPSPEGTASPVDVKEPEITKEPEPTPSDKPPRGFVPKEALDEERRRRKEEQEKAQVAAEKARELESQLQELKGSQSPNDFSDEGAYLQKKIDKLTDELTELKESGKIQSVIGQFNLTDYQDEFRDFRKLYPGVPLENVAKLFQSEKGLLGETRKGLEKPTGGTRVTPQAEMSEDELKSLRETQPRRYIDAIRKGVV